MLAAGFMISAMLVLFFGLTMVLSVFFFSRDLSILVPLPLQPGTIMGSKFAVINVYEYLTIAPFLIPAILVFGSGSGAGPLYWIIALLVFLLTPVIPLGVATIFTLMLMSLTNLSRKRDTLTGAGIFALILLAGWFAYQAFGSDLAVYLAVSAVSLAMGGCSIFS